jgi:quinol monooxygenase YgiN
LIGRIAIELGHRNEFIERTAVLTKLTRAAESPLLYQCCEDITAPGLFIFYEIWHSRASLDAHFQTSHFLDWNQWVAGKTISMPEIRIGLLGATTTLKA